MKSNILSVTSYSTSTYEAIKHRNYLNTKTQTTGKERNTREPCVSTRIFLSKSEFQAPSVLEILLSFLASHAVLLAEDT